MLPTQSKGSKMITIGVDLKTQQLHSKTNSFALR